jgi:predicted transcriptional regulator
MMSLHTKPKGENVKKQSIGLSNEDAIVLQQICESGEEDVINLSRSLNMNRARVIAILESLRKKGLVTVKRTAGDWWVGMSLKGKQFTSYIWPEMAPMTI